MRIMLPKWLLALTLFAALAVMPGCVLQAQWVQTNGPYGGNINAIASIDSSLFVATDSEIYISQNYDGSWKLSNQGLPKNQFISLVATKQEIYAATDSEIFLSIDKGQSWSSIRKEKTYALTIRDSELFACGNGLWKTTDRGTSWSELDSATGLVSIFVDGTNIYAGGIDTFLYSYDDGSSWSSTNRFDTSDLSAAYCVVDRIIAQDNTLLVDIYAGGPGTPFGVYRSLDRGKSWSSSPMSGVNAFVYVGSKLIAFGESYDPTYTSDDDGISWQVHPSDLIHGTCLVFANDLLFSGTYDDGVFVSSDTGATWTQKSISLSQPAYSTSVVSSKVYAACNDRIFVSSDDGNQWSITHVFDTPSSATPYLGSSLSVGDSTVFLSSSVGLFISTNRGITWTYRPSSPTSIYASPIVFMDGTLFCVAASYGIDRSSDSGVTWTAVQLNKLGVQSNYVSSLIALGSKLFAGTDSGIFVSADVGITWKESDSGFPLGTGDNTVLSFSIIGSNIFVGTDYTGVFRSTDSGVTWFAVSPIIPDTGIVTVFNVEQDLFALAGPDGYSIDDGGLFLSTDLGFSWEQIYNGAPINYYEGFNSPVADGYLFLGTESGVWRHPLSDFGISSVAQTPPSPQHEIQSYPNPFSQSTEITFTSQAAGYVDVSVVNLLGVEVARLYSGELGAGEHSFTWSNPTGLPDGMYECLVRMNGQVETLPMLLMR